MAETEDDVGDDADVDDDADCEVDLYEEYMAEDPRVLSDEDRDRVAKAYGMTRDAVDALIDQMGANRDLVKQQRQEDSYDDDDDDDSDQ